LEDGQPREEACYSDHHLMLPSEQQLKVTNDLQNVCQDVEKDLYLHNIKVVPPPEVVESKPPYPDIGVDVIVEHGNLLP
jgi:hypothetical protein